MPKSLHESVQRNDYLVELRIDMLSNHPSLAFLIFLRIPHCKVIMVRRHSQVLGLIFSRIPRTCTYNLRDAWKQKHQRIVARAHNIFLSTPKFIIFFVLIPYLSCIIYLPLFFLSLLSIIHFHSSLFRILIQQS